MAFDSGSMTPADMAAVMKNTGGFDSNGGAWWIVILFLFAMMGGNWNGFGGAPAAAAMANTGADLQRGFDQQATQGALGGIAAQIGNGFSDAAVARCNAQMNAFQTMNANQSQTNQGFNTLALGLQQLGSQSAAGISDLKFTVAQENCNDRQTVQNGLRDLMAQNTANTNAIIQSQAQGFQGLQDKLCSLQIENLKENNARLRTQLDMANLAASQTQQTAQIVQNNNMQTAQLIQRIAPAPIPAYIVANPNGTTDATTA